MVETENTNIAATERQASKFEEPGFGGFWRRRDGTVASHSSTWHGNGTTPVGLRSAVMDSRISTPKDQGFIQVSMICLRGTLHSQWDH